MQAFLNLVKNAAEAIGSRATRAVSRCRRRSAPAFACPVPGSNARISLPLMIAVEDNGPGVPDHIKPHLFDPFVTTKRAAEPDWGSLVAKIIGDHGGVIECESEPKKTVFRVPADRGAAAIADTPSAEVGHGPYDPDRRRRYRDPHGAEPGACARRLRAARDRQRSNALALGVAREGDVIITDVVMPDENAFELIPRIKRLRPDLPIIVMSAQNTLMTALTAAEKGAYEYLPKPFDLSELVAVVGRALSQPGRPRCGRCRRSRASCRSSAARRRCRRSTACWPAHADRSHRHDRGREAAPARLVARVLHDYDKRRGRGRSWRSTWRRSRAS